MEQASSAEDTCLYWQVRVEVHRPDHELGPLRKLKHDADEGYEGRGRETDHNVLPGQRQALD